jgi:hypothetical protein
MNQAKSKPEHDRQATSPRTDFVGPVRELKVDPNAVGEAHVVEPQNQKRDV